MKKILFYIMCIGICNFHVQGKENYKIEFDSDNPKEIIVKISELITLQGEDAVLLRSRGTAYYLNKNLIEAIDDLEKSLKLNPLDVQSYSILGSCYLKQSLYQKAISCFSYAIFLTPDNIDCLINRAFAYFKLEKYELAIKDYDDVLTLKPDLNDVQLLKSKAKLQLDKKT